jgi:hypothetical protein
MVDGVKVIPLTRHVDDRGYLMEILRSDDEHFIRFGQIYVTTCDPQPGGPVIKAWHRHERQTDNFCCIAGKIKVGLHDDREGSLQRDALIISAGTYASSYPARRVAWPDGLPRCHLINIPRVSIRVPTSGPVGRLPSRGFESLNVRGSMARHEGVILAGAAGCLELTRVIIAPPAGRARR